MACSSMLNFTQIAAACSEVVQKVNVAAKIAKIVVLTPIGNCRLVWRGPPAGDQVM